MQHFSHNQGQINYNSDLSGNVFLINDRGVEVEVSAHLLRDFVRHVIKDSLVECLERLLDEARSTVATEQQLARLTRELGKGREEVLKEALAHYSRAAGL